MIFSTVRVSHDLTNTKEFQMVRMKLRSFAAWILALMLLSGYAMAGTSGKITGVVTDNETGDALPGVNVIVEGTTMGAATNVSGEFTIINIPAGVYVVSTSMIGYNKVTKQNVRVLPDFTTRLDFALSAQSLGGEEVVIVAERPLIQKDQTMTMTVTSSEEIKNLPVRGFQGIANLGVGIVVNNTRNKEGGTGNVNVRGGRPNETGVYIDGFQQNNLLTGISTSNVPAGAVEEIQVITGGFDAEYGRNKSGIIQVTTKSGGSRYSGTLEYVNDRPMFALDKNSYYGYDVYSGGLGGPLIPGNNRIKFYVSGEARDITDAEPSATGFPKFKLSNVGIINPDPAVNDTVLFDTGANGNLLAEGGARPKTRSGYGVNSDRGINLQGKLTFDAISNKLRVDVAGNYSKTWRRAVTTPRILSLDNQNMTEIKNLNLGMVATYSINQSSYLDAGLNYFDADRFTFTDGLGKNLANYIGRTAGNTGFRSYYNDNVLQDIDRPTLGFRHDRDTYLAFKTNYVNQIDKHNQLKAGADLARHTVRFLDILDTDNPISGSNINIGYRVNDDFSISEINKNNLEARELGATHPYSFASYLQDKLEYEGFVLRAGLRYDLFNAGVKRVKNLADPTGQQDPAQIGLVVGGRTLAGTLGPEDYTNSKNDYKISPRMSVSFPVSEKTQFRMSYGKFFQQPNLQDLYVSPDFLSRQSLSPPFAREIGNPNLAAERSTQYEVGVRRALSDRVAVDVSAYYKDIQALVNSTSFASQPNSLIIETNADEGVIQGVNLALEVRRTGKFQGRVAYTLQTAKGTGSGEASGFRSAWLGYSDAKFTSPLNFDQRHTINASLDIRNAKGEGPVVGGNRLLENAGVNFQFSAASGLPYTPKTVIPIQLAGVPSGKVLARRNSQNQPWTVRLDLKADKTITLGESRSLNIYIQVLNVLDRRNVLDVFDATGRADNDGFLSTTAGQALPERTKQMYDLAYNIDGFRYDTPRQARLGLLFNF